jgi:hypothetical protein
MAKIADNSPFLYFAVFFFVFSSFWSDLICIRVSLTLGFLGLVLAGLSGHDSKGSFSNMPLSEGIIDLTTIFNFILFVLNACISYRLIMDEVPIKNDRTGEEEQALFSYFQSRCNMTPLHFRELYKRGKIIELEANQKVPNCHRTLYLLIEGRVKCNSIINGNRCEDFVKRSGEFFDIRMYNIFTLPIGFDNEDFQATAMMKSKLFGWDICSLVEMRDLKSPSLLKFWEFTIIRSLSTVAIRHHLKKNDTLYDSMLIPEDESWLWGARSRDFEPRVHPKPIWQRIKAQFVMFANSMQILPPRGIRHRPGIIDINPKQVELEMECKGVRSKSKQRFLRLVSFKGGKDEMDMSCSKLWIDSSI